MQDWIPTRTSALEQLDAFLPNAGSHYAKRRNYDFGPGQHDNVSTLSPWLSHRLLLEREVVQATLERFTLATAEKFVQETCWRTYWKGWLELRPSIWDAYRAELDKLAAQLPKYSDLDSRWRVAVTGQTGIDCFDAWAQELVETGYLHNHARMWFASIWIHTLELPWALGADFFLRHLLDGDPASNTLSWRWVGGLQTRGKTYLARPGNIQRYTENRFHPEGQLAPRAEPLAEPDLPEPREAPSAEPIDIDDGTALLVTEADLTPEFLLDPEQPFADIVGLQATEYRSPLPIADHVADFARRGLDNAFERLGADPTTSLFPATADGRNALVRRLHAAGIRQVVTPCIPTGPVADAAVELRRELRDAGIHWTPALRQWDELAWPYATKGFFAFWKRVQPLLPAMGINTLENAD